MSDIVEKEIEKKPEKKNVNPKGTITLNEAMVILKGKSNLTKFALRFAAVRDGFKSEHTGQGKQSFLLNEKKFNNWVKKTIDVISDGFVTVNNAARELNLTTSYVYTLINDYKIKTKKGGGGRGRVYVDFTTLKTVYTKKKEGKSK